MSRKTASLIAPLSFLLVLVATGLWLRRDRRGLNVAPAHQPTAPVTPGTEVAEGPQVDRTSTRRPVSVTPEPRVASIPQPGDSDLLDGMVVDVYGSGVSGVEVSFEPATYRGFGAPPTSHRVSSGADGSFCIPSPGRSGRLVATGESWVTLVPVGWFGLVPEPPVVVVVAEPCDMDGVVVDASGLPLEGVTTEVVLTLAHSDTLPVNVPALGHPLGESRTGADGTFSIPRLPCTGSATLFARRQGLVTKSVSLGENGWTGLVVCMAADKGLVEIRGAVLGHDGSGVGGAQVAAGESTVTTDQQGRYAVSCSAALERVAVWAVAPGLGSGVAWVDLSSTDPIDGVIVVLERRRSTLSGEVVDGANVLQEGCLVKVLERTTMGRTLRKIGDLTFEQSVTVEQVLAGHDVPLAKPQWCITDARGAFVLQNLADREYTLFVARPSDLRNASFGPVEAGMQNLRLVLAGAAPRHVAGRVRTSDGRPRAGCNVVPVILGRSSTSVSSEQRLPPDILPRAVTDTSGRFDLGLLTTESLVLSVVDSQGGPNVRVELAGITDPSRLDVIVPSATSFMLTFAEEVSRDFNGLRVESEEGKALVISFELLPGASASGLRAHCPEGQVGIIGTDTLARRAVLLRDDQPVRTVPLDLVPGQITTVEVR